jgi:hypothetical protein
MSSKENLIDQPRTEERCFALGLLEERKAQVAETTNQLRISGCARDIAVPFVEGFQSS